MTATATIVQAVQNGATSLQSTKTSASRIDLRVPNPGIARLFDNPDGSLETANCLLQKNHDEYHMFWRDVGGHNHMAHAVLTTLALGGSSSELQRAYDDGLEVQRAMPPLEEELVAKLYDASEFRSRIGNIHDYTTFLAFFEREIDAKGWREVITEYCFSKTENAELMLAQLYEGAFHPIIHLGLGVEFEQPSIVAEALAQAASHDSAGIPQFLLDAERHGRASAEPRMTLKECFHTVREDETIKNAAQPQMGPVRVREGVMKRAFQEIARLAAAYRVPPSGLERSVAEMISCNAYISATAQRAGKQRKIDFFHMHNVTSSIFLSVFAQQDWIKLEDKVRLVEWKARMDLVWFAASGAALLKLSFLTDYKPTHSAGMNWMDLYQAINKAHDDGHVAKFVRAIKNGESVAKPFEGEDPERFPVRGDLWLKVAQMAYDSTLEVPVDQKWVFGAGYDPMWKLMPDEA
ncbi:hypothetical protein CKM354_001001300 [Cercospora kikuchii]|uniref:Oxidoreductase AflY n=1 Tax=Cercospora kikuchii TaxID=84275 RepID=A0A9P3FJH4_9PEZI|nr:uncharacterized protein CKM354_001001300 [Cercospora kikuchii]GIZ46907.1 hypothetical protein CKM354_001001300 [Cercospora kikuchii]